MTILILGGVTFGAEDVAAQLFEQKVTPFPVRDTSGVAYDMPFLGGFNAPRPQLVDIDGDGDLDLFLQERNGRLAYFEHVDAESATAFEWRTDHYRGLDVGAWARFGDLDGDGDPDLLAEEPISNVRYYRNKGPRSDPEFAVPVGPLVREDGTSLFAERQNIPVLAALDCDGPPDLLLGGLDGRLRYRRHTGTSEEGVPVFEKVSDAYQDVCVGPPSVCPSVDTAPKQTGTSARLHGANAIAAGDLGGDGDPDLLWGDFFSESLYLLENTGSCSSPQIERVRDVYPINDPIQTSGYNVPSLGDLDGDDDLDLLVGVLGGGSSGSSAIENLLFLENTAADSAFALRTRRFLRTVDVGGVSAPALVDLDADGDRDLVIGNNSQPGVSSARVHVFENVGSASTPVFEERSASLLSRSEDGFNFVPAFGDVDADGDPDLYLGTFSGTVRFYRNTGTAQDPQFEREPDGDLDLPSGNFATPALEDVDADGDLDLFVGSSSSKGVVAFFRNVGSPESAAFQLETEQFADIQAEVRQTHPTFSDVDANGAPDLVLGTEKGIFLYRNTGTRTQAAFEAPPDSLALPLRSMSAPAVADLDGDSMLDLVAGGQGGGLKFFAGRDTTLGPPLRPGGGVKVHPNPFRRRTQLSFSLRTSAPVRLSVYDLMGRRLGVLVDRTLPAADHTVSFTADGRASGVYLYVLRVGGQVYDRGRLVLVR